MNGRFFIPSVILFGIFIGIGAITLAAHKALMVQRGELQDSKDELVSVRADVDTSSKALAKMASQKSPAAAFMAQWGPALRPEIDGNTLLEDLSRFGNNSTVSVQSRKSGPTDYYWHGKTSEKIQYAEATGVSSEYYRLINWLGDMEHAWPLARFEQIAFEQKGPSLQLSLKLSYPTFLTQVTQ